MNRLLALFVDKLIRHGHLEVESGNGAKRRFGDGAGPKIAVRIADRAAERELLLNPELALGELYMDGRLELVEGDLYDFVALAAENSMALGGSRWIKLLEKARIVLGRFRRRNDRKRAKTNVERHYDHDRRLYSFFLDADQQYSCAYFEHEGQSLEEAQLAKKRHLAAKLLVEEGQSVLDIGSGFGGLALYLAEVVGARADRRDAFGGAVRDLVAPRRGVRPGRSGGIPPAGLSRRRGALRPHRFGRHVRTRRPRRATKSSSPPSAAS